MNIYDISGMVDLIGWFDLRQLTAREKDLRRRLSDPEADHVALLEERHALLLERRARLGVDSSAKVKKHSETNVKSRSGIAAKSESSQ